MRQLAGESVTASKLTPGTLRLTNGPARRDSVGRDQQARTRLLLGVVRDVTGELRCTWLSTTCTGGVVLYDVSYVKMAEFPGYTMVVP